MLHANAFPALVLNADFRPKSYFPLSLISWEDAVKAIYEDTHVVVREYARVVRSPSVEIRLPSVLAIKTFVKPPARVPFTRYNVFLRDRFQCQYCREFFAAEDLTFDHVKPRSKGGETEWTNIAAACGGCNERKRDGVDMQPIRTPFVPTSQDLMKVKRTMPQGYLHESWLDFLYWDAELQT